MACTTILVGKKASLDNSTMIARNDDGHFDVKKLIKVPHKTFDKENIYESKISHVKVKLPLEAYAYTSNPSVDDKIGIWAANGINEYNVCMSATETLTSNPRVLGADPYVKYVKGKTKKEDKIGGIGEEDIVVLVLPYIKSAREGVLRLGALLEEYGTYEPNGIAFSDENEIWWLETIGGHHWIARRVEDDEYVIMPNQFGLDRFDFKDAYSKMEKNMCSKDLLDFTNKYNLNQNFGDEFNPRLAYGSHDDSDHVYNTPRAWYMGRYFNPRTYIWDGENADFTPESDDIPWALKPEHKISVEEVKYILSSYYQGTEYDPYGRGVSPLKGKYRPIGISRTDVMAILQIRANMPFELQALEWICFSSNAFNTMMPLYTNVSKMPKYVSDVTLDVDLNNFYWQSRMSGVLADSHYSKCMIHIERYQKETVNEARRILNIYDAKMMESKEYNLQEKCNEEICASTNKISKKLMRVLVDTCSEEMKNGYHRFDN